MPPRKKTSAMKALDANLQRAFAFVEIFEAGDLRPTPNKRRSQGQPGTHERELLRAAVVMGVGALDAYLSDVAAEVLVAQLERATTMPNESARAILRRVMKEIDTLPIELALVTDATARAAVARDAIADFLANRVSNHGSKGVAETIGRMGASVDWSKASVPKALDPGGTRKPAEVLDEWTRTRHALVHQGKAIQVKRDHARGLLELVGAIASLVDAVALASSTA